MGKYIDILYSLECFVDFASQLKKVLVIGGYLDAI